jgi:hypothetical protein
MASYLKIGPLPSGLALYAWWEAEDGTSWNGTALGAFSAGSWADYAAAGVVAEIGTTGYYRVTVPASLPAGLYSVTGFAQVGGSLAIPDPANGAGDTPQFGPGEVDWSGSRLVAGNEIADLILTRSWAATEALRPSQVTDRNALQALRRERNRTTRSGALGIVMKEDDSTTAWTASVTGVEIDPS